MFDFHDFVTKTIREMIGKEPEYKVRQYAIGWYDKGVLSDIDLSDIDDAYAELEAAYAAAQEAQDEGI